MRRRHGRDRYFIPGEGVLTSEANRAPVTRRATELEELRDFRFSRLFAAHEQIVRQSSRLLEKLAAAMVSDDRADQVPEPIPAGFTYLGQFVDHDLTLDKTAVALGTEITVDELQQGRSPSLDLDSLYGLGPEKEPQYYSDGVHLKTGSTIGVPFPAGNHLVAVDLSGFDLPRTADGASPDARRQALIPDFRNDENLIVGQLHAAFIRLHNRVVDALSGDGAAGAFERAREKVVKHYQWVLRHDFFPRIVEREILDRVFANGRRFLEPDPDGRATMPIEFSVAAYRCGHSMVRASYELNAVFQTGLNSEAASLGSLMSFAGMSGAFIPTDPADGTPSGLERLPTNRVVDWRRFFEFERDDLLAPLGRFNMARPIDTVLVNPLGGLSVQSIGGLAGSHSPAQQQNLAFRNLQRGRMVKLPSGQQVAGLFGLTPLSSAEILEGKGAKLLDLTADERQDLLAATPLWFYILREAEVMGRGRLGPMGSIIVAETVHRAMESSVHSIVRDPSWRPGFDAPRDRFTMVDLLTFAFEGKKELLAPLG